ncbi:hypothetical protein DCC85_18595 [Paenibacillus sp. CAA11]|uniref:DUF5665 domain-containing protein n=1 Tax=Paenibacillus sp. CAA11 TaxID=1532905 RepID=UPI000D33B1AD|nr:DUF5665 domain-containing protein [Paenibacillus sp. CAA11]AWB45980.1 hypothetical protein DCC85_18595 [Paenibacillus sp. CAA11]
MAKVYDTKDHPFELRHEVKRLNTRLDDIATALEKSDFKDIIENYTNPKKRIITNFTAGLSRGLGLTVGTAIVLALLGWIISWFVDLPLIGQYIGDLQNYIDSYKQH